MKRFMSALVFSSILQSILINNNKAIAKDIVNFKNNKYFLKNIKPDVTGLYNQHNNEREKEFQNNLDTFLSNWAVIDEIKNYEVTKGN